MDVLFIPILFVRHDSNFLLRYPRFKHEGAVSNKVTGLNPIGTEFFNYMKRYGIKGIVRNNINRIGCRTGQLYFKCHIVHSSDTDSRCISLTGIEVSRSLHD